MMRGKKQIIPPVVQNRAPTRRRRLRAKPKKAQARFRENRARHAERGLDNQRRDQIRQQVKRDNSRGRRADGLRRRHVIQFAQIQDLPAH